MHGARAALVLAAGVAALAGAPPASASDATCPTAGEPEPVTGEVVAVRWHGGAGFPERCASMTATRAAEPVAQPSVAEPAAATSPPSQAATPAPKAAPGKKAKAKRKSKKARAHAKCVIRR